MDKEEAYNTLFDQIEMARRYGAITNKRADLMQKALKVLKPTPSITMAVVDEPKLPEDSGQSQGNSSEEGPRLHNQS